MLAFKRPFSKNGRKYRKWVNPYLPERGRKGKSALDDLIENLRSTIITRLNQIEAETDFELLLNSPVKEVKEEAVLLRREIRNIKTLLKGL